MEGWLVPAISLGYLGSLFAVAWYGDRRAARQAVERQRGRRVAVFYAMTLMVYFTAWSFYGSAGRAAARGFDFASIYVGPTLVLLFGQRLLRKIIVVAKEQNATSIADFIAARYGKSQAIAALVTISATIALLPYIALQLKAVSTTWDVLTAPSAQLPTTLSPWRDTALGVTLLMALFSILFGVRHINASEHHRGLMLAIAFESVIKLAVFVIVAVFIVFGLFGGFGDVLARVMEDPRLRHLAAPNLAQPSWWANLALSAIAFLCLPQMFHVTVVENDHPRHTRYAAWLLPSYMTTLTLFIVPIAAIGLSRLGHSIDADIYMMALPLSVGRADMALLAFIGGLSAATGMVIVSAVALSTMACNDLVLPLLLGRSPKMLLPDQDLTGLLLTIRRVSVVAVLLLAYLTYRLIDRSHGLVAIGLLSFVAVAQFGPAFIGGLYWRRGCRAGAIGGLCAGLSVWFYALLLPSLYPAAAEPDWMTGGLLGLSWLNPHALFGVEGLDPVTHATAWSLGLNLAVYVALSLLSRPKAIDRAQASAFVTASVPLPEAGRRRLPPITPHQLEQLAGHYVGTDKAAAAFREYRRSYGAPDDLQAVQFTERLLAGAVGAASARVVIAALLRGEGLSLRAAKAMLDEARFAIQFNRDLLQATLENVSQGICVLDRNFRVATWNRRYLDLCNLPEDLVRVGTPVAELVRFNLGRGEAGLEELDSLMVNQDLSAVRWPYTSERRRPDGTVLEICFTRMPDGGFVATYADVTERYRAAAQLEQANAGLEQRVAERTLALSRAKAEAEKANLGKTRFLAAVSHDLLQPLNAARLFVSALGERLDRPPEGVAAAWPDDARGLAANATASLRSAEQLLAGLLDMSALDGGSVRPEIVDFPVTGILSRLAIEFSEVARGRGLALKLRPTTAVVRSDPQLLRRILQNFLSNALRYTAEGRVLLGCRRRSDGLRIEVWDSGPGIPSEQQEEIFQEFHRLPGAADADKGLGLGLAIVERIAGKLNHPITLHSRPGHGTMFAVTVPLGADRAAASFAEASTAGDPVSSLAILCIDNEAGTLAGLRALLEGWGCRVETASGGPDDPSPGGPTPDAVIIDYHLDGEVTGLKRLGELHQAWGRPVPALLVSADRSPEIREAAQRQAVAVLYKPLRPAPLRTWLGRVGRGAKPEAAAAAVPLQAD